jgi:polysaccharide pyruvyl transferase WcaK-like protein
MPDDALLDGQRPASAPDGAAVAILPARPRIALFGQFGSGNVGNDASLDAMIRGLRARLPLAEFVIVCSGPVEAGAAFRLPAVSWVRPPLRNALLRRLNALLQGIPHKLVGPFRAARILRGCDVLLVPGTGFLDDFGERPAGGPYTILKWVLIARLMGLRVEMASIGAGPVQRRPSLVMMMAAARLAHRLSFRDAASRDFVMRHARIARPMAVCPDLAFSLPAQPEASSNSAAPLVLGVMRYRGWLNADAGIYATYIAKLTAFAHTMIEGGRRIRLVIGEVADEAAVADLRAALAALGGDRLVDRTEYTPARTIHDVIAQMAGAELAIATRFHNVVAALLAGTPVISLSYGAKNDILLSDMGLGAFTAHVERFEPDWLVERVATLAAERDRHAHGIEQKVASYRTALAVQYDSLAVSLADTAARRA